LLIVAKLVVKAPLYNNKEKLILIKKSGSWVKRGILMPEKNEIIIYTTSDGKEIFEVNLKKDTVWLSQKQMADLFIKTTPTINEHIKNIFKEGELEENSVIRKFRVTAADSKKYSTNMYNLDVIISVGYRVKSSPSFFGF
jgi:hypothetical protein